MKRVIIGLSLLLLCTASSCTTSKGRFSILDLDLRTPEQIAAYQTEANIPFTFGQQDTIPSGVPRMEVPSTLWAPLFELLKVVKGRLRVVTIEWGSNARVSDNQSP